MLLFNNLTTILRNTNEYISINCCHFLGNMSLINQINDPKFYKIGLLYSFLIGIVIGEIWMCFRKSSVSKVIIHNTNVFLIKYLGKRIITISLFWKLFIFWFVLFLIIDVYQFFNYNNLTGFDYDSVKIVFKMAEDKIKPSMDASNSVINIQNPVTNVSIPIEVAETATTALTTAAGMKAGLELAKNVPGIGAKAAVVVGTGIVAQAVNITANKIIRSITPTQTSENSNSFLPNNCFITENYYKDNEKYSEYPYNLIPDLNIYINIEIWFLIILVNVLLTSYLLDKKVDVNKFIKNDRLRKVLSYIFNRYISIWSISRNLIITWCILILFLCIFMSKLILLILLSIK